MHGPIFCNILADEINRASPKTQAALLQAMAGKARKRSAARRT
ncbi:MAG: AAA family ATPase [Thermodesulfobacteriota bacterium]